MKIIYNIRSTVNNGGMERMLSVKANWLVNAGYEVVIITTDQQERPSFFDFDKRIRLYDIGLNYRTDTSTSGSYKKKEHKKRLTAILCKEKADICISMFCEDVGILPKIDDGSKKIVEFHFCKEKGLERSCWRKLLHFLMSRKVDWIASKFDKVVLLTKKDAGFWHVPSKCVIPNAVAIRADKPAELMNKTVIAVGRYVHQKGFESLIKAWSRIPDQFIREGWKLLLVGSGEREEKYRQLISESGISTSVTLGITYSDMTRAYNDASIMALTSLYEGLPLALIEAQSFGIPAVSFDCNCGPSDIIEDGTTGYLVAPNDIDALAQKLAVLMKDKKLRREMGEKAFEMSARFKPDTIMKEWVNLFKELAS